MKLILDTLERARLAASPSDAIILADAIAELHALEEALDRYSWPLDDAARALDEFHALRDHARAQPFDVTPMDDGTTVVDDLTPGAFADWLADLERLAQ